MSALSQFYCNYPSSVKALANELRNPTGDDPDDDFSFARNIAKVTTDEHDNSVTVYWKTDNPPQEIAAYACGYRDGYERRIQDLID